MVSNTSPIINLACIGQLDILRQLYGSVAIPESVYHEIAVTGSGGGWFVGSTGTGLDRNEKDYEPPAGCGSSD